MRRGRREEGGEERRGLNKCEWVLADLTADLQEPLVPARGPPDEKNRAQGCRHFFWWGAPIFWTRFWRRRVFFVRAPPIFGKSGEHHFSAGRLPTGRRGLLVARPPSHASWSWLICPVSPPARRLGASPTSHVKDEQGITDGSWNSEWKGRMVNLIE